MKRRKFFEEMGLGLGALSPLTQAPSKKAPVPKREKEQSAGSMDAAVEVNLDHLVWNLQQIRTAVQVPIMAVVKANAYGHGLVEVARLLEKEGIGRLMVGKLEEALILRKAGVRSSILNFGSFSRQDCDLVVQNRISQSVYSEEVRFLHEAALKLGRKAGVHLDVDTGMGRTGVSFKNAQPLLKKMASLSGLKIEGVMTTLAEDEKFDPEQLRRLAEVCSEAKAKGIDVGLRHAASSAGILRGLQFHLDLVRPGIMLYGYYPSAATQQENRLSLKPALRLLARVIDIRLLSPGDTLSYHRAYVADRAMWVATVGLGYSEGYPAQLAGKGVVMIKGKTYQVIAAVTANHMMVDLNNSEEVRIGDEIILIGNQPEDEPTADVVAELSAVSVYRILIGLNPLLPRRAVRTEAK
jgi:alanine racemase